MDTKNVQPTIGQCADFIGARESPSSVSIVITLNKCVHDKEHEFDRERMIYGCSKGDGCMNPDCWYSAVMREKKRAEAKTRKEQNHE